MKNFYQFLLSMKQNESNFKDFLRKINTSYDSSYEFRH